jgi:hypothetical protein
VVRGPSYSTVQWGIVSAEAATTQPMPRPPVEVVLPTVYYVILAGEAIALTLLYRDRAITAADPIGHTIGWVGTGSMCVMHVYSIRRRVRALHSWGRLRTWLHVHIFLGLQGALLVTFHSIHLKTVSNWAGLTIMCTLIVVGSGIFGRYLFSLIPKNISGERLSAREVEAELAALRPLFARSAQPAIEAAVVEVERATPLGGKMTFAHLVQEDLRARRAFRHLDRALAEVRRAAPSGELEQFAAVVRRRALLARRLAMLTAAERVFRYWTILHKPLTYILAGAVAMHIVSHYIYAAQFSG